MSLNLKQVFGAALLTLAVVGGAATYLNTNLATSPKAVVAMDGVAFEHPQSERRAEVIVTEGRAS